MGNERPPHRTPASLFAQRGFHFVDPLDLPAHFVKQHFRETHRKAALSSRNHFPS
jgi:hypothetical protein